MSKSLFISLFVLILAACGPPPKPAIDHTQLLIAALVAQDQNKVIKHKTNAKLSIKNQNIINLYLLAIKNEPYQLLSHSQQLIKNYHHYNDAQKSIIKPLLLWAYAHPIYRQETAQQVRLLQREELLVAPSNIDFIACEQSTEGCANTLREQVSTIISADELTTTLESMAHNDPCINLTDENMGGVFGNQCLASRKGDLRVNLLSIPQFLFGQWGAMINAAP